MKDALDALIEKDVAQMQGKLDALMGQINSGFHAVRGSFTLGSDITPASGTTIEHNVACPNGAKIFVLEPADVDTVDKIKEKEDGNWTLWARVSFAGTSEEGCAGSLAVFQAPINAVNMGGQPASNTNGVTLTCFPLVAGTYNWTAYYWNEGEAIPAWTGGSY